MTSLSKIFSLLIISTFLFCTSCGNEGLDKPEEVNCILQSDDLLIEPICSFNPKIATTVPFPVRVLLNGVAIQHDEFAFSWSHDLDFGAAAISVTFEQLPITLTVTELSSSCEAEVRLDNDYWD